MTFEPGKSGNPGGRPKRDKFLTQHLIAELNEIDPATNAVKARSIIKALINKASEGDVAASREIIDRVEGKVPQGVEGDEDNPLHILHRIENVILDHSTP